MQKMNTIKATDEELMNLRKALEFDLNRFKNINKEIKKLLKEIDRELLKNFQETLEGKK